MVAETSINDVLLVVAGGAIGILGSYFSHLWTRTHRSAERIAKAYSEYIAASEQVLKRTVSGAETRTACERVPGITATDDAVRDFMFGKAEQAEDALGRRVSEEPDWLM